ncbi:hypothetical protein BDF21DRAFT_412188 [Thamnidium elegans]|nr:hypothetical protein BDF21DRAFT_412188 [Thamnidium elegans]
MIHFFLKLIIFDFAINYVPDKLNDIFFDCGFMTDGHMIATHFYAFRRELLSSDKDEIKVLKRNANLSSVNKGVYTLDTEPTGLSLSEKDVVRIDPGKSLTP